MTSEGVTAMAALPRLAVDRDGFVQLNRLTMTSVRREPSHVLDGTWDFQLLDSPDAELGPWETTEVPSLWTMTSQRDRPHYTNVPMPFDEVPPHLPERNPTGVYRRIATLRRRPGTRTVLRVGAAESGLHVWVNGVVAGASTDSHLEAEFDITDAMIDGDNEIVLVVTKYTAESYLEDQDHWWHGGIARSVELIEVPDVRIHDVRVVADLDPATALGSLEVSVHTAGLDGAPAQGHTVEMAVLRRTVSAEVAGLQEAQTLPKPSDDRSAKPRAIGLPPDMMDVVSLAPAGADIPDQLRDVARRFAQTALHETQPGEARLTLDELAVAPWSAEAPHLESLVLTLLDPSGSPLDSVELRVGFRRVEVVGADLLVNGVRVTIQGVNRHDSDPRTGRVMSPSTLESELVLMKRSGINAIRTSHYPNDPRFLDLCDEYGFYVVDEADIEGHAFAGSLADDPRYLTRLMERYSRMVLRDRNHPCVIIWSLGNETGYGAAHPAMAAWSRRTDPTRPVQYEGAVAADWYGGHDSSDIVCPMYPAFGALESYAADARADRPLIACEYAYSQGNATGGLSRYWELFESLPGLQGGFIWQWRDHALDVDGDGRYRYGGDFGDEPHQGSSLNNGLVFPDLTPQPALAEVSAVFSPVRLASDVSDARGGFVVVRNRQDFAGLDGFSAQARVEFESGPSEWVVIRLPQIGAGDTGRVSLPTEIRTGLERIDALALTIEIATAYPTRWAPVGTVVATLQIEFPGPMPSMPRADVPPMLAEDGSLVHPLLATPPELCLWRAMTESDNSFALDKRLVRTGFFALHRRAREVIPAPSSATVRTVYEAAYGDHVVHLRTIRQVGPHDYVLQEQVDLPEETSDGLRIGMEFTLVDGFSEVSWMGLGPHENYPDRRYGASLGTWQSPIDTWDTPYVMPQENGTRGAVRRTCLKGPAGSVTTTHARPLHFNASRHTVADLEEASHWWELPQRRTTTVHLDVAHRGVGTGLIGPDTLPAHRLAGSHFEWTWRITLDSPAQS